MSEESKILQPPQPVNVNAEQHNYESEKPKWQEYGIRCKNEGDCQDSEVPWGKEGWVLWE